MKLHIHFVSLTVNFFSKLASYCLNIFNFLFHLISYFFTICHTTCSDPNLNFNSFSHLSCFCFKKEGAKLRKRIEKLNLQLTSGIALSQQQRKAKEKQVDNLKKELQELEQKLTELKVTKINVKLHLE